MKLRRIGKSGQEEIVGFGLILIIVAVIGIVFIMVYIKRPVTQTEDYEASTFIQAALQYTSVCEDRKGNLSVEDLIFKCKNNENCGEVSGCVILNNTLKGMLKESWKPDPNNLVKGYSFVINVSDGEVMRNMIELKGGIVTNKYRGSQQDFGRARDSIVILFHVYN